MRTIFETCDPRPEVLQGDLREEIFAARLKDVIDDTAEPVYGNPAIFFDNTYPTDGLKLLLSEALGRLTGLKPANNPIIRLETAFGGGKTHNLIGLYHAARGNVGNSPERFVDPALVPAPGLVKVVGVVGSDLDPASGIKHKDVTTFTLWGELAYQLGGRSGYELVADSDRDSKAAPGTGLWEQLIGDRPTLILLDEIARHLRSAKAIPTGTQKSDLAEQIVAFLMSLLEFAASKEHVVLVLTLADVSDAFGKETEELRHELGEARRVSARQERVITPTGESEISAIVTHRLFQKIDKTAAREASDAYHSHYARLLDQGVEIPQRAARAEYASELAASYPFHPELLNTLNRKTSTIPNFQKTRGALRLLAATVRQLWQKKPADCHTIHIHHLDLSVGDIADDLTSRLERAVFKQVIEADIVSPLIGSPAHAQAIDHAWLEIGKPPYAQRVATTVFLHSLTQGAASGVDPSDLNLAVLQHDDDPTLVSKAIERLLDSCWFLDYDGHRYRFGTEPSPIKIIVDEMALVGKTKAKAELDRRIKLIWQKGVFEPIYFPNEAADVDDDAKAPKIVVIHYDAASTTSTAAAPPDLVRKIFDHAGALGGYRIYKNNLVFLVADQDEVDNMVEVARKHLALGRIVSPERLKEFNLEQQKKFKGMFDASELEVRVAVTKAYRHLFYPSADAPQANSNLAHESLPAQDQGDVQKDQSAVVLKALRQLDKVLTAEDKPLNSAYVKAKAWDAGQVQITTDDLRRAFAKRLGLRMLLDLNQIKKTIRDGAKQGTWIYYDAGEQVGYGPPSPQPLVQVSEDAVLYTPEEAKRLGIAIKGEAKPTVEETCPVCGMPISRCICGEDVEGGGGGGGQAIKLHAEGTPAQAFQTILDQCQDQQVAAIGRLFISIEGTGKAGATDARALGLAVPQLGKGQYHVEQTMGAEFGEEQFSLRFSGSWDRYKRVKTLTDQLGQEATKLTVKTSLRADFADGLPVDSDQFQTIRDVFDALSMGKVTVDAQPVKQEGTEA